MLIKKELCKKCLWYSDCFKGSESKYKSCAHFTNVSDDGTVQDSLDEYISLSKESSDLYNEIYLDKDDVNKSCVVKGGYLG